MSKEKLFLESFKKLLQEENKERKKELAKKSTEILLDSKIFDDLPDFSILDDPELRTELFDLYVRRKGRNLMDGMKQIYFEHTGNFE